MSEKDPFKNQDKRVNYDNIIYLINTEINTAGVIGIKGNHKEINIPCSITHESNEYYITSILENALKYSKIEFVHFTSDSKLQTIEKNAFCNSQIKKIRIPSSVTSIGEGSFNFCTQLEIIEIPDDSKLQTINKNAFSWAAIKSIKIPSELINLEEGWCCYTKNLTKISVSSENPRYFCYEDKMIIGKSRIEQSNYDCLIFCVRNIQQIKIPNFIEHICSFSFNLCNPLEIIEFSNDSKLQTIDKYAFSNSQIKIIKIPSSVTSIGEKAFLKCKQLEVIEIPDDSKLQTIGLNAFSESTIERIKIPSKLIDLKEGWCNDTIKLTNILVSPENPRYCFFDDKMIIGKSKIEQSNYDCLVFSVRDIQQIKIPNFIEHICSYSFNLCKQLEIVEFSNDSKLQTIEKNAFSSSQIKSIRIPSSVTSIEDDVFSCCKKLEVIEIPDDSKLRTIGNDALCFSAIKSIKIPSELIDLKEEWCKDTQNITEISVSSENPRYFCYEDKMIIGKSRIEQNNYDCLVFCVRDIQQIKIPNFIEHICSYSFDQCRQLEIVEFSNDPNLQTIGKGAFSNSQINIIRIPSSVTSIGEFAFSSCNQLEVIEIPDDSKLQVINKGAFFGASIKKIRIPSSVTSIGEFVFSGCDQLEVIEIPDDSKLQTIGNCAFINSKIKSIQIPSSVTFFGDDVFTRCTLRIIEVRNVEMISIYQTAFKNCRNAFLMIPVHS